MHGNYRVPRHDQELLQRLVSERGGSIFTEAPVAGPFAPWGPTTPATTVDAVWFPDAPADGVRSATDAAESLRALSETHRATLVTGRGYLDRTAFGVVLVGRLLYARSFSVPLPRCLALTEARYPHVERVYRERQIDVFPFSEEVNRESVRASSGGASEDPLLLAHYAHHYRGKGTLLTEARIPPWRVDGLWCDQGRMTVRTCDDVGSIAVGTKVELIEVKPSLNTDVIGQAVAGATRLGHIAAHLRDAPTHVVVGPDSHEALDWACGELGVSVFRY